MTRPEDARRRDEIPKDLAADFDCDDEALWGILGVLEEDAPAATSPEFVRSTLAKVQSRESTIPSGWSLFRRPVLWVGSGLAAAALIAAVTLWPFGQEPQQLPSNDGNKMAEQSPSDMKELQDVVKRLSAIEDSAWLGLDVASAEADDVAWFGN